MATLTGLFGDEGLDDLVALVALACEAPIALVTLVDDAQQHFLASRGFVGDRTAPLSTGWCPVVVSSNEPLIIPDTLDDPRHAGNPAAAVGGIRFYAGFPLIDADGLTIGTLCVLDRAPRSTGLKSSQRMALRSLANQVVREFELRRAIVRQEQLLRDQDVLIRERSALADVQHAISHAGGDMDRILAALVGGAMAAVPAATGAVLELLDGDELSYREVAGTLAGHRGLRLPLRSSLAGACIRAGGPLLVNDVVLDGRAVADLVEPLGLGSALLIPVTQGHETLGVLKLQSGDVGAFAERDLQTIQLFAGTASAGLTEVRAIAAERAAAEAMKQANRALAAEAERSALQRDLVWQLSSDLFVVWGPDGRYLGVNPAWTAATGRSIEDLVGGYHPDLVHPDDMPTSQAAFRRLLAGETIRDVDTRMRQADGGWRTYSWTCVPKDGRYYGIGRDVTESRTIADQLRRSQRMEAVGQLTGGIAHDFNNLLTIVRSSVDLLRRPDLPVDKRRRYLDAVSDTVDRAARLTGQLLAFARRQSLTPSTFDVGEKLRQLADMTATLAGSRINLRIETPDTPCHAHADVAQFETAILNMAANARDAMDGAGELHLSVTCRRPLPALRGHAGSAEPFVAIAVRDSGVGIAPDVIGSIFEPFFTTKAIGKGTGLGLSQVFGFAKQSGGDVDVASAQGAGATFTLYLPQVDAPGREEIGRADRTVAAGDGRAVLVVEDNVDVGRFTAQILSDLGYDTTLTDTAESALDLIRAEPGRFDVVFSDVVMPGMGGVELATRLRRDRPDIPIILASGYSHVLAADADHGFRLLRKPYSAEQLSRELRSAMRDRLRTVR